MIDHNARTKVQKVSPEAASVELLQERADDVHIHLVAAPVQSVDKWWFLVVSGR